MLAEAKTGVLELLVLIPFLHSFLRSTHVCLLVFLLTHLSWGNVCTLDRHKVVPGCHIFDVRVILES